MALLKFLPHRETMNDLEYRASLERKSKFLTSLLYGWIGLHLLALTLMLAPPMPPLSQFFIISLSLLFSLGIFYLNRYGSVQIAAFLFCLVTNTILILAFTFSLAYGDAPVVVAILGNLLSIGILFAGMLFGREGIFWFTLVNISAVIISFFAGSGNPNRLELFDSFPIASFLFLVAVISWLYQKTLNQALDSLTKARREAEQAKLLQREVEIARDLQQHLYPTPPNYEGRICFAARSEPAQLTGGDFYDFIELAEDKLAIVVADAAGKSLPAAMVMAMARSIIRHGAQPNLSPADVLRQAHETAHKDTNLDQMITCFYGVLDLHSLRLEFANAGHPYPILKRNGGLHILEAPGFPLNSFPDPDYQNHIIQLRPGDYVLWISDGIIEAHNTQRELFGFERLETTFQQANGRHPQDLLNHIWSVVLAYQNGTPQADDLTIVVASIDKSLLPVNST